ncbi:hypothetical protein F6Y05_02725 [Bacillus megaterium]|nr:hypothetical protein [Priestia megaterium]
MTTIRESQRESQQTIKETASSIEQLANYQEQMNKKPKTMRDRIAHWFGSANKKEPTRAFFCAIA